MKISKQIKSYNKEFFYNKRILLSNEEDFYKLQNYLFDLGFRWVIDGKQEYDKDNAGLTIHNYKIYYFFLRSGSEINYKDLNI